MTAGPAGPAAPGTAGGAQPERLTEHVPIRFEAVSQRDRYRAALESIQRYGETVILPDVAHLAREALEGGQP